MANKNKATHSGTCQACGNLQKLPGGVLSKHGYDVQWHFFNGVCLGAGHKPFEQSTDLIERCIAGAQEQLKSVQAAIAQFNAPATEPKAWVRQYRKISYGISKYTWEYTDVYERQMVNSAGDYKWLNYFVMGPDNKLDKVSAYGEETSDLNVAAYCNRNYVKAVLVPRAAELAGYIKWQQERVANWTPAELKPVK